MAAVDFSLFDGGLQTTTSLSVGSTALTDSDDLNGSDDSLSSVESVYKDASSEPANTRVVQNRSVDECCPVCFKTFLTTRNLPRSIAEHMIRYHHSQYTKMRALEPSRFTWTPLKSEKKSDLLLQADSEVPSTPRRLRKRQAMADTNTEEDIDPTLDVHYTRSDSRDGARTSRKRRCIQVVSEPRRRSLTPDSSDSREHTFTEMANDNTPSLPSTHDVGRPQGQPMSTAPKSTFISLKQKKMPLQYILSDVVPLHYADLGDIPKRSWLQLKNCLVSPSTKLRDRAAYECAACTSRNWRSGGCRFENLRLFLDEVSAESPRYVLTSEPQDDKVTDLYQPNLSTLGLPEHSRYLLRRIASSLRSVLQVELAHERNSHTLRRSRIEHERPVCDGCSTTIFSGNWMCYTCARDLCLECYSEWDDSPESVHAHLHLNLCKAKRGAIVKYHTKVQMIPYTRFRAGEIESLMSQIDTVLEEQLEDGSSMAILRCHPEEGLPYAKADHSDVSLAKFQQHWSSGEPLVLSGFLGRFNVDWSPAYFIEKYGEQGTDLVDVIKREVFRSDIRTFFSGLQNGDAGSMSHLKLNDWPDVDDFAIAMPDLFQDFEQALPFPIYTQRRGHLNLAAWFPPQYLPPDLGPKLYCAGPSSDAPGHHGTTVLHMDMTDAVNIMTWAGTRTAGRPGAAVWDIFPKEDADALRRFLLAKVKAKTPRAHMDDPIRRAQFYLTTDDLEALRVQEGVQSWRIYQNPGEAVFIPAGCAHQVCNLAPCIKVACDFVSPENVDRCADITRSDRRLAALAKREDVLQLKNLIYFAWSGVSAHLDGSHDASKPEVSLGRAFDASAAAALEDNLEDDPPEASVTMERDTKETVNSCKVGRIDDRVVDDDGLDDLSRLTGVDQSADGNKTTMGE